MRPRNYHAWVHRIEENLARWPAEDVGRGDWTTNTVVSAQASGAALRLVNGRYEVTIPDEILERARIPIERMIAAGS